MSTGWQAITLVCLVIAGISIEFGREILYCWRERRDEP